jgi:hypothetical protein
MIPADAFDQTLHQILNTDYSLLIKTCLVFWLYLEFTLFLVAYTIIITAPYFILGLFIWKILQWLWNQWPWNQT